MQYNDTDACGGRRFGRQKNAPGGAPVVGPSTSRSRSCRAYGACLCAIHVYDIMNIVVPSQEVHAGPSVAAVVGTHAGGEATAPRLHVAAEADPSSTDTSSGSDSSSDASSSPPERAELSRPDEGPATEGPAATEGVADAAMNASEVEMKENDAEEPPAARAGQEVAAGDEAEAETDSQAPSSSDETSSSSSDDVNFQDKSRFWVSSGDWDDDRKHRQYTVFACRCARRVMAHGQSLSVPEPHPLVAGHGGGGLRRGRRGRGAAAADKE